MIAGQEKDIFARWKSGQDYESFAEDGGEWKCFYTRLPKKERLIPVLCVRRSRLRCFKENVSALFRRIKDVRALLLPPEL